MRPPSPQWMVVACGFILLNLFPLSTLAAGNQVGSEVGSYSFNGNSGGPKMPYAGLIRDSAGNLYGTTEVGGTYNQGTVFEVTPNANSSWTESVLYNFTGGLDGAQPSGGLTFDTAGNLYGTTNFGGSQNCKLGCGTIFKLTPASGNWTESVVYTFTGGSDGREPYAGLMSDAQGNFYGTTLLGGNLDTVCPSGCGTVFKLSNSNGAWTENVLYAFAGGSDGAWPHAGLTFDGAGNLYGTTNGGGTYGSGTVFRLTAGQNGSWTESVLHTFTGGQDGKEPRGSLIFDTAANLYGTTFSGGVKGYGVVFKLVPTSQGSWQELVLHSFMNAPAANPVAGLVMDAAGNLYGTTLLGADLHSCGGKCGTLFKLSPASSGSWTFAVLHLFGRAMDGYHPSGQLIRDAAGNLYGTTQAGGAYGAGLLFEISVNGVMINTATLPNGTVGTPYSTALTASGGTAPYSWTLTSGALPAGLGLSKNGTISGTPTSAGQSNFTVQVTDSSSPVQKATKPFSISISAGGLPLTITTVSLPNGIVGTAYSSTLTASGGTAPYSWTVTSGALPAGLSLSKGGTISGTPTSAGQSNFTVQVTDSSSPTQDATKPFSISISNSAPMLTITTASLPNGTVGTAYSSTLMATGGTTPYSWTVVSGSLPGGLSLSQGGTISGTPTSVGQSNFTVQVTDSSSPQQKASKPMSITISSGDPSSVQLYIVGNTTSTTYPVTNDGLCEGCPSENGIFTTLAINAASTKTTASSSTHMGGAASPGVTQIRSIWVDPVTGDVFTGGRTSCELNSVNNGTGGQPCHFPITAGAFQTTYAGGGDDAVICRWTSAGVNEWCSYLGTDGTQTEETVYGIAGLDPNGDLAVCGRMNSMPGQNTIDGVPWTKIGQVPANQDTGYIAKITADGSALVWFTSFGGSSTGDGIRGRCALDSSGNVYAGGESGSVDFPTTAGVFQPTNRSSQSPPRQGIVVAMKADGTGFLWATYLGGSSQDQIEGADGGIVVDANGDVYVGGMTSSADLFPNGTPGFQTTFKSPSAGSRVSSQYVAKIKSDGTQVLAGTYLGGVSGTWVVQANEGDALALDGNGNVVVMGDTFDTDFPTTPGAYQATYQGQQDATLSKLSPDLQTLIASTYVGGSGEDSEDHSGGIVFDASGNIYATVATTSSDFPTTTDAFQGSYIGNGTSRDIAIFGVSSDMTTLVYGTYLAGAVQNGDTDGNFPWALAGVSK